MLNSHVEAVKTIAEGLGELNDEVVFVGGAVTEFYASMPGAGEIRVTLDVDCVIEISTKMEYEALEELLRSKGFQHDTTEGAPVCRWIFKSVFVDIMPTNEEILGFSNKWYLAGIENKKIYPLSKSFNINLFHIEYLLASKIEAIKNRGGNDLRQSHDFEDIVFLLENDPSIMSLPISSKWSTFFLRSQRKHLRPSFS